MFAGTLNRRIRIERRVSGTDAAGQPIDTWETVVDTWADIKGQTGLGSMKEMQGNLPASVSRYSIRIRYRDGLDAGMRVWELRAGVPFGKPFDIKQQPRMDFARRGWTDLVCEVVG